MVYRLRILFTFLLLIISVCILHAQEADQYRLKRIEKATKFLSAYVSYPSLTGNELEAGQFFAEYCQEQGLHLTYFSTDTASYNFAATLYPLSANKPVVWFQHHIDVVPATDEDLWEFPPFSGTVENDTIYGRGVVDCKGLGVMQLMALLEFKELYDEEELNFNVGLLCFSAEEFGGELGAAYVLANYLPDLKPAVVFGEGGAGIRGVLESDPQRTIYGVSVAEKAALWLKLELELVSFGHGATPAPSYANKVMINSLSKLNNRKMELDFNRTNKRMFRRLGKAEGGIKGFLIRHINWWVLRPFVKGYIKNDPLLESLTTNTITVTKIFNPPGPPNKISTTSTAFLDCRLQPGVSKKAFIRKVEKILDDPRISIKEVNNAKEANATSPDKYFEAMEEAILHEDPKAVVIPVLFPATTDNSLFRALNISTYGFVPAVLDQGTIASVHNVNEKLPVIALEQGIKIYRNFLLNLLDERVRVKYRRQLLLPRLETRQ